jgi:hypothetical protein
MEFSRTTDDTLDALDADTTPLDSDGDGLTDDEEILIYVTDAPLRT